jgi:hypothetical protein
MISPSPGGMTASSREVQKSLIQSSKRMIESKIQTLGRRLAIQDPDFTK